MDKFISVIELREWFELRSMGWSIRWSVRYIRSPPGISPSADTFPSLHRLGQAYIAKCGITIRIHIVHTFIKHKKNLATIKRCTFTIPTEQNFSYVRVYLFELSQSILPCLWKLLTLWKYQMYQYFHWIDDQGECHCLHLEYYVHIIILEHLWYMICICL